MSTRYVIPLFLRPLMIFPLSLFYSFSFVFGSQASIVLFFCILGLDFAFCVALKKTAFGQADWLSS